MGTVSSTERIVGAWIESLGGNHPFGRWFAVRGEWAGNLVCAEDRQHNALTRASNRSSNLFPCPRKRIGCPRLRCVRRSENELASLMIPSVSVSVSKTNSLRSCLLAFLILRFGGARGPQPSCIPYLIFRPACIPSVRLMAAAANSRRVA